MSKLIELDLGEDRTVLVETDEDISVPRSVLSSLRYQRVGPEASRRTDVSTVQEVVRGFVDGSVAALREVDAEIERVQFEFNLGLGGDAGVPYITNGAVGGALKVTVQCNLAKRHQRLALDPDE